ncbi:hypothetical protein F2P81_012522 [Scophthalmus maximus]|uniref:EGF-like domain-containing protein n=1 Tax=Scophthalmus maximus TaxID=52904 RepID=A0A6A4SUN2_SCOMX|nr:hypothetical protein F2P81_012522 [Scophthalmus maximus]
MLLLLLLICLQTSLQEPDGYSGFACQECKNQNAYGEKCDKECDCVHGVCNKGPEGNGECLCQPPYTGKNCDQGICAARDCDVNAQCSTQGSKVTCACKPDYLGDGKICVPRNPCSENNGGCPLNSTVCVFKGANKGFDEEMLCHNHVLRGQHLFKDLEGRDRNFYGGGWFRSKGNKLRHSHH